MDRKDYDEKVQQMLNNQKTYKILDKDPTAQPKKNLMKSWPISTEKIRSVIVCTRNSEVLMVFHLVSISLPKVLKPGYLLRPIISFIDSPTYMLSKHLAQTLKPLVGNTDFTVKKSLDFCDQIKHAEDDELVSFDVISLFTSIPVELAIQVATDVLSKDDTLHDRTAIPVEDIVALSRFLLVKTNFKYNTPYQQIFGTAMGSPVSAVMANLSFIHLSRSASVLETICRG